MHGWENAAGGTAIAALMWGAIWVVSNWIEYGTWRGPRAGQKSKNRAYLTARQAGRIVIGCGMAGVVGFLVGLAVDVALGTTMQSLAIAGAAAVCSMVPVLIGTALWADRAVR